MPLLGWIAIASTALRNSAELGLTTSVFFARFVAMRLVEEGFGESIPAVVIHVYSMGLTIPGEVSLRGATHLEQLPKTLTSLVSHQVQGILTGHGIPKYRPIPVRRERQLFDPESSHLKKILLNFGHAHATSGRSRIEPMTRTRSSRFRLRGERRAQQAYGAACPHVRCNAAHRYPCLSNAIIEPSARGDTYLNRHTSIWINQMPY